jgi:hypothetical protein
MHFVQTLDTANECVGALLEFLTVGGQYEQTEHSPVTIKEVQAVLDEVTLEHYGSDSSESSKSSKKKDEAVKWSKYI